MRPLDGLLVIDFSTLLPGPMATLLLAEAGAEVVKVERPGGEEMRHYQPRWGEDSVNFALLNRSKKSIVLDLKDPAQRGRLMPLIERADVLVEQFRPGVMDRLGLGYPAVAAHNPRIVYCSITGYGQTGPKATRAGHDLNYIGDAGLLSLSSGPLDAPVVPPALIADIAGGAYPAVMNILLGLRAREHTGRGMHLDIAMTEGVLPFLYWALGEGQALGAWPGNGESLVTGGTPRYRLYRTADDRLVAAAPIEDKFWNTFCDVIGLAPAERNDQLDPSAAIAAVATLIRARPAGHWRALFARTDCCCSVVASVEEAVSDPHFVARGAFAHRVANRRGETIAALPVPIAPAFRDPPGTVSAPALGADTPVLAP
jgi:crotonobetainyl-CoA:carnitine CoA-transferase CaiB-like acyl-CoA transferase